MDQLIPKRAEKIENLVNRFRKIYNLHYDERGVSLSQLIKLANILPTKFGYSVIFERIKSNKLYGRVSFAEQIIILNSFVRFARINFIWKWLSGN